MSVSIEISADLVDTITALATAGAAAAAAWAVISANGIARRARQHQRLAERHVAAVELLAAWEQVLELYTAARSEQEISLGIAAAYSHVPPTEAYILATARFRALLRSSEEPLPITRGVWFDHTGLPEGFPSYEEAEAYLEAAPMVGNPESEEPRVRQVRAELVASIEILRARLSA